MRNIKLSRNWLEEMKGSTTPRDTETGLFQTAAGFSQACRKLHSSKADDAELLMTIMIKKMMILSHVLA